MSDKSLKLQVILAAVDKATAPMKAFTAASSNAAKVIKETQRELKQLEKQQAAISNFRQLGSAAKTTQIALADKTQQLKKVRAEIAAVGVPTEALIRKEIKAEAAVKRAKAAHIGKLTALKNSKAALIENGVAVTKLAATETTLKGKVDQATASINKHKTALSQAAAAQAKATALNDQYNKSMELRNKIAGAGAATMAAGGAMLAPVAISIKNFAEAEDAATQLKVAMMTKGGGISDEFIKLNDLAMELGNRLPGTTADFQNLMTMLKRQGMSNEVILGGTGEAAAYLAVQLKMAPEAAAEFAAKMQDATRTLEADMMPLMDTIQKGFYAGVETSNMLAAFSDLAPAMDTIRMKGAEGAKALAPLVAQLDQAGLVGGSAGNALRKIFQKGMDNEKIQDVLSDFKKAGKISKDLTIDFTDGKGEFGGLKQMYKELEKLKGLNTETRLALIKEIYGDNAEVVSALSSIIEKGQSGYDEFSEKIDAQASLQERVGKQLGTLKNIWEATEGTITNVSVALGETLAPELKEVTAWLGNVSEKTGKWVKEHPALAGAIMKTIAVVGLLLVVFGGLMVALAAMMTPLIIVRHGLGLLGLRFASIVNGLKLFGSAFMWLSRLIMANPIILAIGLLIFAGYMLYKNWDGICSGLRLIWQQLTQAALATWNWIKNACIAAGNAIVSFFMNWSLAGIIYSNWDAIIAWCSSLPTKFFSIGGQIVDGIKNGIAEKWAAMKAYFMGLVSDLPEGVKKVLGIHSPSRVFAEIGMHTISGLNQGLVDHSNSPLKTVLGLGSKLIKAGSNLILPSPSFTESGMGKGMPKLATGGATSGGGGNTYQIYFNLPAGISTGSGTDKNLMQDLEKMVERVVTKIERQKASSSRSSFTDKE